MLAIHAGYAAARIGLLRPATSVVRRYIAPVAAGDQSGSDWANAAPIASLNAMIGAVGAGGEVLLRADAGPYAQNAPRTISAGGTADQPVVIRGVDVNGADMEVQLVGTRMVDATGTRLWNAKADTAAGVYGAEAFRLNAGANHLTWRFIGFKNQGRGCFRIREAIAGLTIEDCRATNVAAFLVNDAASTTTDASVVGLTIARTQVRGFSKFAVKLEHDSRDILIEDFVFDSERQDGDNFASGIVLGVRARDAVIRRGEICNIIDTIHTYQNGDGAAGEYSNRNILMEDVYIHHCTDGGVDFKGDGIVLRDVLIEHCPRSFRIWGYAEAHDCISREPSDVAGPAGKTKGHFCVFIGGMLRLFGCRLEATTSLATGFLAEGGGIITYDAATTWSLPAGAKLKYEEPANEGEAAGQVWPMPVGDTTPPVVTSPTSLSIEENKIGRWDVVANKVTQLRVLNSSGTTFSRRGPSLAMFRQDYEALPSPTLIAQVQLMDLSGNVSVTPHTVQILDVADFPLTPAESYAWYESHPAFCWQDVDATIPAEVGRRVARRDDRSGHGNHQLQADPDKQAILREEGGAYFMEYAPGALQYYTAGAPGAFNLPSLTCVAMIRRGADPTVDENGNPISAPTRAIISTPRGVPGTANNARWEMTVSGGRSFGWVVGGGSGSSPPGGTSDLPGATVKNDRVLSLISDRTITRIQGAVTNNPGTSGRVITYSYVGQTLIGALHRSDGTIGNSFFGRDYGIIVINGDAGDTVVSRAEITAHRWCGKDL